MRGLVLAILLSCAATPALSNAALLCSDSPSGVECFTAENRLDSGDAEAAAKRLCKTAHPDGTVACENYQFIRDYDDACAVVYINTQGNPHQGLIAVDKVAATAVMQSLAACMNSSQQFSHGFNCRRVAYSCDGSGVPLPPSTEASAQPSPSVPAPPPSVTTRTAQADAKPVPPTSKDNDFIFDPSFYRAVALFNLLDQIRIGITIGIIAIAVIVLFAKRAAIANYIIHGNLPYKLPVYGEDIQCLFKRSQRINWYGRVVFGLTANLSMSHDQLTDVRKYWLGRVIAFDSLRRQRQNELAQMHLQLAAATPAALDANLRSIFKTISLALFYLIRSVVSFLFGFLFIRVNIARLVRGTVIESKDLVLLLQAKEAIEHTAKYLKEYLTTANTFDGRDEVV